MKKSVWWIKTRKLNLPKSIFGRAHVISCAKSKLFTKLCMVKWSLYIPKKIFGMSAETSWMRPIWLLGYQDGVEIYEGWTLKVIKVYFPFCWELFFSRTETCHVVWSAIFSVNRNKGFVFIILLPELNGLVR